MLRITSGQFRGRLIQTPSGKSTRPTQARLRQALFNSLQTILDEAVVLDLFAGSGALGFEALSRGASSVVFVENDRQAARLIAKNAETLGVTDRIQLIQDSVERAWHRFDENTRFNLVLADPPYAEGWESRLLTEFPWDRCLKPGGWFCVEWGTLKSQVKELPERVGNLVKVREKIYGESVLSTYQKESDS